MTNKQNFFAWYYKGGFKQLCVMLDAHTNSLVITHHHKNQRSATMHITLLSIACAYDWRNLIADNIRYLRNLSKKGN